MCKLFNFFLFSILISFIAQAETTTGIFVTGMGISNYIYDFGGITPPKLEFVANSQRYGSPMFRSLVVLNSNYAYAISQTDDFLYIFKINKVYSYDISNEKMIMKPLLSQISQINMEKYGCYDATSLIENQSILHVICASTNNILSLSINSRDGTVSGPIGTIYNKNGYLKIVFTHDGTYAFTLSRAENAVTILKQYKAGIYNFIDLYPTFGDMPKDMELAQLPDNKQVLYVSNFGGKSISVNRFDRLNGKLDHLEQISTAPYQPLQMVFVKTYNDGNYLWVNSTLDNKLENDYLLQYQIQDGKLHLISETKMDGMIADITYNSKTNSIFVTYPYEMRFAQCLLDSNGLKYSQYWCNNVNSPIYTPFAIQTYDFNW